MPDAQSNGMDIALDMTEYENRQTGNSHMKDSIVKLGDPNGHTASLKERFAEQTTFHGVGFWLNPKKSRGSRALYFFVWLMMAAIMVKLLYSNVTRYLQFQTKVSISSDEQATLMFPSITICPENQFLKSKVGGSKSILEGYMKHMRQDYPLMEACHDPSLYDHYPDMNHILALNKKVGVKKAIESVVFGFEQVVRECSLKMSKIDCSELFIGHMTSIGRCFTFNHGGKYCTNDNALFWIFSEKIKVLLEYTFSLRYDFKSTFQSTAFSQRRISTTAPIFRRSQHTTSQELVPRIDCNCV